MRRLSFVCLICAAALGAADWSRFRGPNGTGVSDGPAPAALDDAVLLWRAALPPGHSSPVVWGERIYLTAAEGGSRADAGREKVVDEGGTLWTYCLDRRNGEVLWKREAPRPRLERYQPTNSPASPTPAVDAAGVYVFFGDFGLLAYDHQGAERWRHPLGPFNNVNGHGSSPIVADGKVVLICDQDTDSYLLALRAADGAVAWRADRSEVTRSYTTPALFEPPGGPAQLIVPGAYTVASYDLATGEKLWWARGLSWQPKSTPVVSGDWIWVNSWEGGGGAVDAEVPTFSELLIRADADGDGRISPPELAAIEPKTRFEHADLGSDGYLDERDWNFQRAKRTSTSALVAIRPRGRGDITATDVVWRLDKFLPNTPSPLLYEGVLYLVKDGGIFTALDPETGEVFKQGRLGEALEKYYASPVAAAGRIYLISEAGKATVVEAGKEWRIVSTRDFGEDAYATPALADGRVYLRTNGGLYAFGERR